MKNSKLEWKVGLFVLIALAGLSWLVFRSGDFYMRPGFTVKFIFDSVRGIETGSAVALSGVKVGEITAINIVRTPEGRTQVEALARLDQGTLIEEDAEVRINSEGMLGEKYVEILPGTAGAKSVVEGGTLPGKPPVVLDRIAESGNRLINKMETAVDNLNQIVSDPAFKESVKGTFGGASDTFGDAKIVAKNMVQASADLKEAAASAKVVFGRLQKGEGTVGRLLQSDKMARDLEAFAAEIKAHPWRLLKRD